MAGPATGETGRTTSRTNTPAPEGSFNFRDLGGWPTEDGGRTRRGLIYRSGELDGLTAQGWRQLARMGVRRLFDFRRQEEVGADGRAGDVGIAVRHVPMWDDDSAASVLDGWMPGEGGDVVTAYGEAKVAGYRRLITRFAPEIGSVIRDLAGHGSLPAVLHCAAGKDRTGIVAAVLLRAVGVAEQDVLRDYLASRGGALASRRERYLPAVRAAGGDEDAFARIHAAHPEALVAALADAEGRWGSIEAYLTRAGGVGTATLGELRRRFVSRS